MALNCVLCPLTSAGRTGVIACQTGASRLLQKALSILAGESAGRSGLAILAALLAFPLAATTVSGHVSIVGAHKHGGDSGVVIWLDPRDEPPPIHPAVFRMAQRQKQFQPHVLAIPVGSSVDFPNFDPIFHNAFSNVAGKIFDVGL